MSDFKKSVIGTIRELGGDNDFTNKIINAIEGSEGKGKPAAKKFKKVQVKKTERDSKNAASGGNLERINSIDLIPKQFIVMTNAKGELAIDDFDRNDYVALKEIGGEDDKTVFFIYIRDAHSKPKTIKLSQQLKHQGYRVVEKIAPSNVIDGIYQKDKERQALSKSATFDDSRFEEDFDKILYAAAERGVSDIHFEVRREDAVIRMRENGQINVYDNLGVQYAMDLCRVIYTVVAEEKQPTFTPNKPQDAVADRTIKGTRTRVRIATIPAYPQGLDMVLRLLPLGVDKKPLTLKQLGYCEEHQRLLKRASQRPVGCFIISGSTGSGKSTTLKHVITGKVIEYDTKIKIITVEDPPEYQIYGATQSPVVRKSGKAMEADNPFTAAVRAAMRSDPDILMVGEVRDGETARLLVSAVQSGHQAFTTVHASSSIGIIQRLQGMGIPGEVIGSGDFIAVLVNQTLCPTNCSHCSISAEEYDFTKNPKDIDLLERLEVVFDGKPQSEWTMRMKGNGCSHCNDTGISGRQVIAEVLLPNEPIRSIFATGDLAKARMYWLTEMGGITILEDGINKMLTGGLDPHMLEHRVGPLDEVAEIHAIRKKYYIEQERLERERHNHEIFERAAKKIESLEDHQKEIDLEVHKIEDEVHYIEEHQKEIDEEVHLIEDEIQDIESHQDEIDKDVHQIEDHQKEMDDRVEHIEEESAKGDDELKELIQELYKSKSKIMEQVEKLAQESSAGDESLLNVIEEMKLAKDELAEQMTKINEGSAMGDRKLKAHIRELREANEMLNESLNSLAKQSDLGDKELKSIVQGLSEKKLELAERLECLSQASMISDKELRESIQELNEYKQNLESKVRQIEEGAATGDQDLVGYIEQLSEMKRALRAGFDELVNESFEGDEELRSHIEEINKTKEALSQKLEDLRHLSMQENKEIRQELDGLKETKNDLMSRLEELKETQE